MNGQNDIQAGVLQRPADDNKEAWIAYWKVQGQEWRTEPEIDAKRQKELTKRLAIVPDIKQGIYPFKNMKLSRADIEWLLATHESGRGPVDWSDESQRERKGLDVRGADLSQVNLNFLPLTGLRGSLTWNEWLAGTETGEQRSMAAVHMEKASIGNTNLEGANLYGAQLNEVALYGTNLEGAGLGWADLKGADLGFAVLEGADLRGAALERALLFNASLKGIDLREANLEGANLSGASLEGANLSGAKLEGTLLMDVVITNSKHIGPQLADIQWGDTNLAVVDFSQITMLGDEYEALNVIGQDRVQGVRAYKTATRAYRQLSVVLSNQGLNEDAARFIYRAKRMQRKVFWYQRKFAQYLGSLFLDLLSGYGYRVGRCFIAYALVIGVFATIYHLLGTHPAWNEAVVISMTAFHGRGFFPDQFHPGDPQALAAAIEAFVGLLIEITLIVTLTQRLFGK